VAVEDLELAPDEPRFDLAFAVRVGALDGRHPAAGARALPRICAALTPTGRLLVDGATRCARSLWAHAAPEPGRVDAASGSVRTGRGGPAQGASRARPTSGVSG
jgi:hypothetical protein